jgi:hypothetical protein
MVAEYFRIKFYGDVGVYFTVVKPMFITLQQKLRSLFMIKKYYIAGYYLFGLGLALWHATAYARGDSNPFPRLSGAVSGDVVHTIGSHLETMLKYALVGGGGLLILICLGVLVHRIREDNREKDHGNLIMTFVMLALGLTIGFVLIGIGWTAFSTDIGE